MTLQPNPAESPLPESLAELTARYLQNAASAHEAGLSLAESGEVEPFEATPAQPVDPRLAWDEARAVLRYLQPQLETTTWKAPPDWSTLVAGHEPLAALPFCLGNFPQLVRDLHSLLHPDRQRWQGARGGPLSSALLLDWSARLAQEGQPGQTLLAAATLRLARHFDQSADLLQRGRQGLPVEWAAAWANEEAALAWHRGRIEEAATLWAAQADSVPVLFNRGMAALFLNRPAEARASLQEATRQLPESDAWHHLGGLYLALAELRG